MRRHRRFLVRASDIDVHPMRSSDLPWCSRASHEFSSKYGARFQDRLDVSEIDAAVMTAGEHFLLAWSRSSARLVEKPKRRSFGSTFDCSAPSSQLDRKARLDFEPAGVQYLTEAPLAALRATIPN